MIVRIFLNPLGIFIAIASLIIVAYIHFIPLPSELKDQLDFINTLVTILGVLGLAFNVYYTIKRAESLENSAKAALKNTELIERGQVSDRFNKAVEQLESEKLSIRLGGIYVLEQIARDNIFFHWIIMTLLVAFIQENAPYNQVKVKSIPKDIQVAITVIGRRNSSQDPEGERLVFEEVRLPKANFTGDFSRSLFKKAHLNDSNFYCANLSETVFLESSLLNTSFDRAIINTTVLQDCNIVLVQNLTQDQQNNFEMKGNTRLADIACLIDSIDS